MDLNFRGMEDRAVVDVVALDSDGTAILHRTVVEKHRGASGTLYLRYYSAT